MNGQLYALMDAGELGKLAESAGGDDDRTAVIFQTSSPGSLKRLDFNPGDGTSYTLDVFSLGPDYPRGKNGTCAFCCGDPCAEREEANERILGFFRRNRHADTCPMCFGQPT